MIIQKNIASRTLAVIVTLVWLTTPYSYACGPFFPEAVFTHKLHPDFPLAGYAAGDLGVLQPTYARSYLYVAYRYLNGIGFDNSEQKALAALWDERLNPKWEEKEPWIKEWLAARSKVPGVESISVSATYRRANDYQWYANCLEDTFRSAIKTLGLRIEKFGANSVAVREWLVGQDAVLANCSRHELIPSPLPSNNDPILRADRTYQIAAANFYAGHFAIAEKQFREISVDPSSPWSSVSAYLTARTLVRAALVDASPDAVDRKRLAAAQSELEKLLANDTLTTMHAPAKRLLGFVRIRLQPEERLKELAHDLLNKNSGETLKQDLWDYTALLDRQQRQTGLDDLTDWIFTFQNNSGFDVSHALEKWQATKSLHWLVAVIAKIGIGRPEIAEILRSAARVDRHSPAYLTVLYHRTRILAQMNRRAEARQLLDQFFARPEPRVRVSSQNLFRAQKLTVAQNFAEFLQYAPRKAAMIATYNESPESPNEFDRQPKGPYFDNDAVETLNTRFPLELLKEASLNNLLPANLRRELAMATWVRAVLLDNEKVALEITPELARLIPILQKELDAYISARDAVARKATGLFIILRYPGMRPYVTAGVARATGLRQIDDYRDNWWCAPAIILGLSSVTSSTMFELSWKEPSTKATLPDNFPPFMSENQKNNARKEISALLKLESAPNYLGKQVIAWAKKNPSDPRVPEALYWVVRSTRYGCGDERTSNISKQAFELLHKTYPKSEWTKKTPYWF